MMRRRDLRYVDKSGQPLDPQMHEILDAVGLQLRRDFPTLLDPCVETEILETAGQLVTEQVRRQGAVVRLHAYTLKVARRLAWKRLRRANALQTTSDPRVLEGLPATHGTARQTEAAIVEARWFRSLPAAEQPVYRMRWAGFKIKDIAKRQGTTVNEINAIWRRVKRRLLRASSPTPIVQRTPVSSE